jgi:processive 1,2-diacylglycerol beta-glucosyltransferase
MPARVLILSAGIGEGHDLPARMLAEGLAQLEPGIDAPVVDGLAAMGTLSKLVADDGSDFMFEKANWLFDFSYLLFARFRPTRAFVQWVTHLAGSRGVLRLIAEWQPDVIVSTYPGVTEVLGHLRAKGRIVVPVVSAITDLAGLRYWVHPGVDLHLITEPESIDEVRAIAPGTRAVCVRGLTAAGFEQVVGQADAREHLGLPQEGSLVVVSGGGWAVGDLRGAARAALAADAGATVVVLCGRSDDKRAALGREFAGEPRLRTMGFTDEMPALLAAADVLVHSTAGLTVFEARLRGCRVISYGWGVAHIRLNNAAYQRFGLARVVTDAPGLDAALRAALAEPRVSGTEAYAARPAAAAEVLALKGAA